MGILTFSASLPRPRLSQPLQGGAETGMQGGGEARRAGEWLPVGYALWPLRVGLPCLEWPLSLEGRAPIPSPGQIHSLLAAAAAFCKGQAFGSHL